jgi:multidrug resistance efflux pump
MAGSSRFPRLLARSLALVFVLFLLAVWFLPWQQFVSGTGKVIAFDPLDRRINVEAPVLGTVRKLYVVEGQRVKKGDVIVEIQDNDPNLLANLRITRDTLIARRAAAAQRVDDFEAQARQKELEKGNALEIARQRIAGAKIDSETNIQNYTRISELRKSGLVSERDYEVALQGNTNAVANLKAAQENLQRTESEFNATIQGIRAQKATAESDHAPKHRKPARWHRAQCPSHGWHFPAPRFTHLCHHPRNGKPLR